MLQRLVWAQRNILGNILSERRRWDQTILGNFSVRQGKPEVIYITIYSCQKKSIHGVVVKMNQPFWLFVFPEVPGSLNKNMVTNVSGVMQENKENSKALSSKSRHGKDKWRDAPYQMMPRRCLYGFTTYMDRCCILLPFCFKPSFTFALRERFCQTVSLKENDRHATKLIHVKNETWSWISELTLDVSWRIDCLVIKSLCFAGKGSV